jgi:hypothetical protein
VRLLLLAAMSMAGSGGLTIGLSNAHPAARPVALRLRFDSLLQCGQPVGPPVSVELPAAERVPRKIAPATVIVNGGTPSSVTVSGRLLTIRIPRPEVLCDVIARGTIGITFTRAANLGNPARAGTYRVSVHRGTQDVSATFVIH